MLTLRKERPDVGQDFVEHDTQAEPLVLCWSRQVHDVLHGLFRERVPEITTTRRELRVRIQKSLDLGKLSRGVLNAGPEIRGFRGGKPLAPVAEGGDRAEGELESSLDSNVQVSGSTAP